MTHYRQALLDALTSEKVAETARQYEEIVTLLPEIAALRATGMEFEHIAALLSAKGLHIEGDALELHYRHARVRDEENRLSALTERYKSLAEAVVGNLTELAENILRSAIERAATSTATPTSNAMKTTPAANSKPRASDKEKNRASSKKAKPNPTAAPRVVEPPAPPYRTLKEVEAMLSAHIDLSKIPRRADRPV